MESQCPHQVRQLFATLSAQCPDLAELIETFDLLLKFLNMFEYNLIEFDIFFSVLVLDYLF
jgi:hypothetical protein